MQYLLPRSNLRWRWRVVVEIGVADLEFARCFELFPGQGIVVIAMKVLDEFGDALSGMLVHGRVLAALCMGSC